MKIFGIEISRTKAAKVEAPAEQHATEQPQKQAYYDYGGYPVYGNVFSISYDGEKNLGELGPIKDYVPEHQMLRLRSWQLFLESEVIQTAIRRTATWVVGEGLSLKANPAQFVLKSEKIELDKESFNLQVEERFCVYAGSTMAHYGDMHSLHQLAFAAYTNAILSGDCLVILRVENGNVNAQLIDGQHVCNPLNLKFQNGQSVWENGNIIRNGVELDAKGKHVAYHVKTAWNKWERIPARGEKTGMRMAFMVYGLEYRLDTVRGIPIVSAVMETAKKMERYKEATIGSAEERQKMVFSIEHEAFSDGSNPLVERARQAIGGSPVTSDIPTDTQMQAVADKVVATTNKTALNMPIGAKLKQLESTNELSFKEFYEANRDTVFAAVNIPPNVAMSKYDTTYSSARTATKDWEHTLRVARNKDFAPQFYQPFYELWLYVNILQNKVDAPGYLTALARGNRMVIEAYHRARFAGANVPHIDPVKEVTAERLKLGKGSDHIPLTTVEAATEALSGGDSYSNMEQYADELNDAYELGIEKIVSSPGQAAPAPVPEPDADDE